MSRRENALALRQPPPDRPPLLRLLPENEPKQHIHAAHSEEEERGDEGEVVDVVREDGRADEALEDPERPQAELAPEDGEVAVEEGGDPAHGAFGEDEHDDLEDDEEAVDDGPEDTGGLIWHGTVLDVVAVCHVLLAGVLHE